MTKEGDIVQVTDFKSSWFPCLVIVTELKSFGIQGYTAVPTKGDAFIRLSFGTFEKVGEAIIVSTHKEQK